MKKNKKYTEEQLSRILSHIDNLHRYGQPWWMGDWISTNHCRIGCINQIAYNEPYTGRAYNLNPAAAGVFDLQTEPFKDPDELLAWLERNKLA